MIKLNKFVNILFLILGAANCVQRLVLVGKDYLFQNQNIHIGGGLADDNSDIYKEFINKSTIDGKLSIGIVTAASGTII